MRGRLEQTSDDTSVTAQLSAADVHCLRYMAVAETYNQSEECMVDGRLWKIQYATLAEGLRMIKGMCPNRRFPFSSKLPSLLLWQAGRGLPT